MGRLFNGTRELAARRPHNPQAGRLRYTDSVQVFTVVNVLVNEQNRDFNLAICH